MPRLNPRITRLTGRLTAALAVALMIGVAGMLSCRADAGAGHHDGPNGRTLSVSVGVPDASNVVAVSVIGVVHQSIYNSRDYAIHWRVDGERPVQVGSGKAPTLRDGAHGHHEINHGFDLIQRPGGDSGTVCLIVRAEPLWNENTCQRITVPPLNSERTLTPADISRKDQG